MTALAALAALPPPVLVDGRRTWLLRDGLRLTEEAPDRYAVTDTSVDLWPYPVTLTAADLTAAGPRIVDRLAAAIREARRQEATYRAEDPVDEALAVMYATGHRLALLEPGDDHIIRGED